MNKVNRGSIWTYIGTGGGKGLKHQVLFIENGEITTWSEPEKGENSGGYTWNGDEDEFLKTFSPVK